MKQSNNKIVFIGSSKYSSIDEEALFNGFGLSLVVTTKTLPNPVRGFADEKKMPVISTDKFTDEIIDEIKNLDPDFLVVADFRLILPKKLLEIPKKACINVHHSLLPKYRGPAPVPFAILNGEKTVGVTIILMNEEVDAGDILAQEKYQLKDNDTTDTVLTKLNELGGNLAVEVIKDFDKYFAKRTPQDESQATYSNYMTRQDGYIDLNNQSSIINNQLFDRKIRAYYPWPGVWFKWHMGDGIWRIVKLLPDKKIQVEGKKPVSYKDFINGYSEGKDLLNKLNINSNTT